MCEAARWQLLPACYPTLFALLLSPPATYRQGYSRTSSYGQLAAGATHQRSCASSPFMHIVSVWQKRKEIRQGKRSSLIWWSLGERLENLPLELLLGLKRLSTGHWLLATSLFPLRRERLENSWIAKLCI